MSTTGRNPVIAAPTPTPVKPASEIGVSITREGPNSSTRPDKTLNGVPASATSSPKMHTRESLRISSASASRTACAKVSSRWTTSGIHVLLRFFGARIWSRQGELHGRFHLGSHFRLNAIQRVRIIMFLFDQPVRQVLDWIALCLPLLLFLLRAVILAVDVAHMVSGVAVGIAHQECGPFTLACAINQSFCGRAHRPNILAIDAFRGQPECSRAG